MSQKDTTQKAKQLFEKIVKKGPMIKSTAFSKNGEPMASNASIVTLKDKKNKSYARMSLNSSQ
jgi:hypothetical protein